MGSESVRLNVIAIGGRHQLLHIIPLALELSRRNMIDCRIFVADDDERNIVLQLASRLAIDAPDISVMSLGPVGSKLPKKIARLWKWRNELRSADALLSAERTSTILKRLPGRCPPFLHILHGAGDREKGFEPRLGLFDFVFTAGEKDRQRIIEAGLQDESRVAAIGGIKIAVTRALPPPPKLFANELPIVLYNPHFSRELGTFHQVAEPMIRQFGGTDRYNLVIAPHVRLKSTMTPSEVADWNSRSGENILVDLGSDRSNDMTYTRSADVYIGDVSSQVYEFIIQPRPCVFVDANDTDWRDDPNYRMWQFGEVLSPDADFVAAADDAIAQFSRFYDLQAKSLRDTYAGLEQSSGNLLKSAADLAETVIVQLGSNDRLRP